MLYILITGNSIKNATANRGKKTEGTILMEERLTDMEIKISYLEHTIEELNDTLIAQGKILETLEKEVKTIKGQLTKENEPPLVDLPPE